MAVAGIDVGSQSTKVAILEGERILADSLEKDDL
jgi:activator of 2-hydroxyglutaryl-CoA dehydratase